MQAPFNNIVQHLFHQPSLQSVTVDELEGMAQAHPYFAAAHFLLLKKMQQTAHPQFTRQLHKTTLYFNNPLWLQFLLQPETVQGFTVLDKSPFFTEEPAPGIPQHDEQFTAAWVPLPMAVVHEQPSEAILPVTQNSRNEQQLPELEAHTTVAAAGMMDIITEVFQDGETTAAVQTGAPAILPLAAPDQEEGQASAALVQEEIIEEAPIPQQTWLPDALVTAVNDQEGHFVASSEIGFVAPDDGASLPAVETPAENEQVFGQAGQSTTADQEEADATDAPVIENMAPETPLLKNIIETQAASNDTLFEPYHTVDYFASQGIKLSKLEIDAKDKLGRQLKSFTEWLKTMKRLPQVSIDKLLSENEESKVVADAIHSIENKEVITEAMAEVFEKQGMNEKAVEVYQKLSLLEPAKSTYFAAKIAILKH